MKVNKSTIGVAIAIGLVVLVGGLVYAGHMSAGVGDAVACAECGAACTGQCTDCPLAAEVGESGAQVDPDKCIGCGRCVQVAPEAYEWNLTTRKAEVKPDAPPEALVRGAEACPVDAVRMSDSGG